MAITISVTESNNHGPILKRKRETQSDEPFLTSIIWETLTTSMQHCNVSQKPLLLNITVYWTKVVSDILEKPGKNYWKYKIYQEWSHFLQTKFCD